MFHSLAVKGIFSLMLVKKKVTTDFLVTHQNKLGRVKNSKGLTPFRQKVINTAFFSTLKKVFEVLFFNNSRVHIKKFFLCYLTHSK